MSYFYKTKNVTVTAAPRASIESASTFLRNIFGAFSSGFHRFSAMKC